MNSEHPFRIAVVVVMVLTLAVIHDSLWAHVIHRAEIVLAK